MGVPGGPPTAGTFLRFNPLPGGKPGLSIGYAPRCAIYAPRSRFAGLLIAEQRRDLNSIASRGGSDHSATSHSPSRELTSHSSTGKRAFGSNWPPLFQIASMITASFLASATLEGFRPRRFSMRNVQS